MGAVDVVALGSVLAAVEVAATPLEAGSPALVGVGLLDRGCPSGVLLTVGRSADAVVAAVVDAVVAASSGAAAVVRCSGAAEGAVVAR